MKKVMMMAVLAFMAMSVQAQMSVNGLMRKYKNSPKAEYVHVPKVMITLAKAIKTGDADDYTKYLKHIDSIKVLDMEDCSKADFGIDSSHYDESVKVINQMKKIEFHLPRVDCFGSGLERRI